MHNLRSERKQRRTLIGVAILFLLSLVALGGTALRIAEAQVGNGQETIPPAIPVIAPGSAYRQTNFVSDVPGFALIQDPSLVNPWGITVRGTSPFWIVNNGTSTVQLVRGDVGGAPLFFNPSPQTIGF